MRAPDPDEVIGVRLGWRGSSASSRRHSVSRIIRRPRFSSSPPALASAAAGNGCRGGRTRSASARGAAGTSWTAAGTCPAHAEAVREDGRESATWTREPPRRPACRRAPEVKPNSRLRMSTSYSASWNTFRTRGPQDLPETLEVEVREGVDEPVLAPHGHLEEADLVLVAVEGVRPCRRRSPSRRPGLPSGVHPDWSSTSRRAALRRAVHAETLRNRLPHPMARDRPRQSPVRVRVARRPRALPAAMAGAPASAPPLERWRGDGT